jgi:hypothetical protein
MDLNKQKEKLKAAEEADEKAGMSEELKAVEEIAEEVIQEEQALLDSIGNRGGNVIKEVIKEEQALLDKIGIRGGGGEGGVVNTKTLGVVNTIAHFLL